MFKLIEKLIIYADESKSKEIFTIEANKWLDFNTAYSFTSADGTNLGKVARKGWKSLWKSHYELYDEKDQRDLIISEENPFTKVMDSFFGDIPFIGLFAAYFFNPKYAINKPDGKVVANLTKDKSFWGRKFSITKATEFENGKELRILLGRMMILLDSRRA